MTNPQFNIIKKFRKDDKTMSTIMIKITKLLGGKVIFWRALYICI